MAGAPGFFTGTAGGHLGFIIGQPVFIQRVNGALCTVARFSMVPLVKQIRELEE